MKRIAFVVMAASLAVAAVAAAQPPARDVSARHHPNLAAAQRLVDQAYHKVAAAQQANEFDLGGHAARAKELLDQANNELKQAAEVSNEHHR